MRDLRGLDTHNCIKLHNLALEMSASIDTRPLGSLLLGDRDQPRHGAEALLWAVFMDGIEVYCRGILTGATNGLTYREAERWIFSPFFEGGLTGFCNLCDLFRIDPRRLRRGLLRFRDNPQREVVRLLKRNAA